MEEEKLYFFDTKKKKTMHYALLSLEIENFRGIKHLKIDSIPADTKWIFLTGENGFGKTSILQGIGILLADNVQPNKENLGSNFKGDFISGEFKMNINITKSSPTISFLKIHELKIEDKTKTSACSLYGSSRLDITAASNDEAIKQQSPLDSLFGKANANLLNINHTLKEAFAYNKDRFQQILEFFKAILPNLSDIKVEVKNGDPEVVYYEKDESGHSYNPIGFSQLAAGYRNILAMFGDMIIRLQRFQPEVKKIKDLKGIVIIDEIELHLHPKYQKWLPNKLSKLFPNIQFIVSTHSPIPMLGAPKESVFLKVNRNEDQGIMIERLDINLAELNPNILLTSPVFGFEDIFSQAQDKTTTIRKEDVYNDMLFYKKLDEKLESHVGSEREKELLKLM